MIVFMLLLALSMAYLICYAAHCFRIKRVRAAIGALVLTAPSALLILAFVSIMLQTS